jgi:hypothetical protein
MKLKETLRSIIREEITKVLKETKTRNRITEAALPDEKVKALVFKTAADEDIFYDRETHDGFIIIMYYCSVAKKMNWLERKFKMDPVEARDDQEMMDEMASIAEAQIKKTPANLIAADARKEEWNLIGKQAGTY